MAYQAFNEVEGLYELQPVVKGVTCGKRSRHAKSVHANAMHLSAPHRSGEPADSVSLVNSSGHLQNPNQVFATLDQHAP